MTVSDRIRQARKALNMSQVEFARAICVSNGYIAELEGDFRKVNDRIIRLIALTFGISEPWLKDGKGAMLLTAPTEKLQRMISLFNELPPMFQVYVVVQIEQLLNVTKEG
jgi:transcriptional regulator with XRE-family HTH domain